MKAKPARVRHRAEAAARQIPRDGGGRRALGGEERGLTREIRRPLPAPFGAAVRGDEP